MKRVILIAACVMLFNLVSCQANPNTEIVQKKGDIKQQIQNSTSSGEAFTVPEVWVEQFTEEAGKLSIDINASITIPQAKPLVVAAEPMMFTQEFANLFLEYFISDKQVYRIDERKTKKEIEAEILKLELALKKSKEENNNKEVNPEESYNIIINKFKEDWKDAPDSLEKVVIEKKFVPQDPPSYMIADILREPNQTDEEYEQVLKENEEYKKLMKAQYNENVTAIKGQADLGKHTQAIINLTNDKMNNNTIANFSNLGKYKSVLEKRVVLDGVKPHGVDISLDEALSIAQDFLNTVGIEYMKLRYVQIGILNQDGVKRDKLDECYILNFTKSFNDFYETFEKTDGMRSDGFQYFRSYERMVFCINNEGILQFSWTNPISYKETISEKPYLIDCEKVQSVFRQQIKNLHIWKDDPNIVEKTILIDKVTLGLMRVSQPNNAKEYLLIPVWDFFGKEIYKYDENLANQYALDENNQIVVGNKINSFMTINAIDGTIIDRALGY